MNAQTLLTAQESLNLVTTVVNQAVVRPLGDPYTIGISGLIFDIVDVVDMNIENDITDHYVEQNYNIQDHIAQKPIIITMKGYAAEKVAVSIPTVLSAIFTSISGLIPLGGLAPSFNAQDSQFYANLLQTAQLTENVANSAMSIFQIFNQAATIVTRQQSVFGFLIGLRNSNTLCTVETPWGVFTNMAIMAIRPLQSGETVSISEFVVTFKQIRTVASISGTVNVNSLNNQNTGSLVDTPTIPGGSFQQMVATPVNLGNDSGQAFDQVSNQPITVQSISQNIYTQQLQPY